MTDSDEKTEGRVRWDGVRPGCAWDDDAARAVPWTAARKPLVDEIQVPIDSLHEPIDEFTVAGVTEEPQR